MEMLVKRYPTKNPPKKAGPVTDSIPAKRPGATEATSMPTTPVQRPIARETRKSTLLHRSSEMIVVQPLFWKRVKTLRPASM